MAFVISETESLGSQRVSALGPAASVYKNCTTQLKELQDLLGGKVTGWPKLKRANMPDHDAYNDYSWFCDYFSNAISSVGNAIDTCQHHGLDPTVSLEAFLRKIDNRQDEFNNLRTAIETNRTSIPKVADKALETLSRLEASKNQLRGEVSTWLGEQKQPKVITH